MLTNSYKDCSNSNVKPASLTTHMKIVRIISEQNQRQRSILVSTEKELLLLIQLSLKIRYFFNNLGKHSFQSMLVCKGC